MAIKQISTWRYAQNLSFTSIKKKKLVVQFYYIDIIWKSAKKLEKI